MGRVAFDDDYVEYSDSRNAPLLADGDFGDLDVDETELTTFQATVLMMKGFVGIGWMSIAYGFGKARGNRCCPLNGVKAQGEGWER
jgi:hypothetical protein